MDWEQPERSLPAAPPPGSGTCFAGGGSGGTNLPQPEVHLTSQALKWGWPSHPINARRKRNMELSPTSRRVFIVAGLMAPFACRAPDESAGDSNVRLPTATDTAEAVEAQTAYPRTTFGAAREIELTPPPDSTIVIVENESFEIWVNGDILLEKVLRGSAYEDVRGKLRERLTSPEPVRLSLEFTPLLHFTADFLRRGEAAILHKDTEVKYDRIIVVPWSIQRVPDAHLSGGVEYRLVDGEVILREAIWIQ